MKSLVQRLSATMLLVSVCAVLRTPAAVADDRWSDSFFVSGLDNVDQGGSGQGACLTVFHGDLIAGGAFEHADGIPARNVARWDGIGWSGLGSGFDSTGNVLTVYRDTLLAGINTDSAGAVVKWNGNDWEPLGSGMSGDVKALAIYRDTLIAGGNFDSAGGVAVNHITRWDGSTWQPLGMGMTPIYGYVHALTIYNGDLIAAGAFDSADGGFVNNIARWDGVNWYPLGTGLGDRDTSQFGYGGYVHALTVYDGKLIAAGHFKVAGGDSVNNIASWDGSSWSSLDEGVDGNGYALVVYGGDLIVGGSFDSAGTIRVDHIAGWDGSDWYPLGSGMSRMVRALAVHSGTLVAMGGFAVAGGQVANGIASWNGSQWSAVSTRAGNGFNVSYDNHRLSALCEFDGKLIAGGLFTGAGDLAANSIAVWNGANWSALGTGAGMGDAAGQGLGDVSALMEYDGDLIAGGYFGSADGVGVRRIARFNGASWQPLGLGVALEADPMTIYAARIEALEIYDGDLIAGGLFDSAGATRTQAIARWDGMVWDSLGPALSMADNFQDPLVFALTIFQDDLIVGGRFDSAGGVLVNNIARFDGITWYPLGLGVNSDVYSLTVYGGQLIAGGSFDSASGVSAASIARWDGFTWQPLGAGMSADSGRHIVVNALTVYAGDLYAGGSFDFVGGVSADNIARWYDSSWHPMGLGTYGHSGNDWVHALQEYGARLYVAGEFLMAGGKPSTLIAEWQSAACLIVLAGDVNVSGEVVLSDIIYLVNYVFKAGPDPQPCPATADVNCDSEVRPSDIIYLVNYVLKGGPAPCDVCTLIPGTWTCE